MKSLLLVLLLGGCALQPWCDNNPRSCDVVESVTVVCVAAAAGLITQKIHKPAIDLTQKEAPYIASFEAADQTRRWFNTFRQEVPTE